MGFSTAVQKACFEKLILLVRDIFGDNVTLTDGAPLVSVAHGSSVTMISVAPMGEREAIVTVRAVVVFKPMITPELELFLLRANTTTVFGAFGISPAGDVVLEHSLIGTTLSREEVEAAVITIARTSDQLDDEIVARWGGERARDKVDGFAKLMDFEEPDRVSH